MPESRHASDVHRISALESKDDVIAEAKYQLSLVRRAADDLEKVLDTEPGILVADGQRHILAGELRLAGFRLEWCMYCYGRLEREQQRPPPIPQPRRLTTDDI
jgi:hypothetical protein